MEARPTVVWADTAVMGTCLAAVGLIIADGGGMRMKLQ